MGHAETAGRQQKARRVIPHKNYVRPTGMERLRMDALRKAGCILSMLRREKGLAVPTRGKVDMQHLKDTTHTLGHWYTIALHSWYHRGIVPYPLASIEEARERYGASLVDGSKTFFESHGITQRGLWEESQRRMGMSTEWPASKVYKAPLTEADVSQG